MTVSLSGPSASSDQTPSDVSREQNSAQPLLHRRPQPIDHETVALQSSQLLRVRAAEFYRANGLPEALSVGQTASSHRLFKSGSMSHLAGNNNNNNTQQNNNDHSKALPHSSNPPTGQSSFGQPDFRASYGMGHLHRRPSAVNQHYHSSIPSHKHPPERPQRTHSERSTGPKVGLQVVGQGQGQTDTIHSSIQSTSKRNGHQHNILNSAQQTSKVLTLQRSNSSLDLEQHLGGIAGAVRKSRISPSAASEKNVNISLEDCPVVNTTRRRDYGSASSLDVIGTTGDSFFAMLREYRNNGTSAPQDESSVPQGSVSRTSSIPIDQRSPGPAKIQDYLRGSTGLVATNYLQSGGRSGNSGSGVTVVNLEHPGSESSSTSTSHTETDSPKLKSKFQRLLLSDKSKSKEKVKENQLMHPDSILLSKKKPIKAAKSEDWTGRDDVMAQGSSAPTTLDVMRLEDKLRKKLFAHYDCQSLTANLTMASWLRNALAKRRNTTTGASAASQVGDCIEGDADTGDGRYNELVQVCPFFRNELGGEEERQLPLNRFTARNRDVEQEPNGSRMLHKPMSACGLSVLESSGGAAKWKFRPCPYEVPSSIIEGVDHGATFYRTFFEKEDHQNWLGVDEELGPLAISIKKERVSSTPLHPGGDHHHHNSYRVIVRTSGLNDLRGTILEDTIPGLCSSRKGGSSREGSTLAKEVIEFIAPEIQLSCLRLATPATEAQLIKLDEQKLNSTYKVGVLYCKAGQSTEEEMYNNEHAGPTFDEFLETVGRKVCLKDFQGYKGGLDCKTDTTGTYSVYNTFEDCEIMFHVSTMLPYTIANRQQILRKRHIGNDIVTIVFQEPGAVPFTPKNIRSRFQHVFIVIQVHDPCSSNTRYSVAITRSKDIAPFGPPLHEGGTFGKDKKFSHFLLAKIINAENAAHRSHKFATMAQRTRQECIRDLATNYVTQTCLTESTTRFSILNSFGGRSKKDKISQNIVSMINSGSFVPDRCVREAISWCVQVEDYGQSGTVYAYLAISAESIAIVEHMSGQVVFGAPTSTVLGFSSQPGAIRIFYHQGESLLIRTKEVDFDEIREISSRLEDVSGARETVQLLIERNSHGQLGFHVNYEGIVQEVEKNGNAYSSGLRPGSRLVEACHISVATLTYDQLVDILKTSQVVSITIVLPYTQKDGNQYNIARRGCGQHNCSYLEHTLAEYEGKLASQQRSYSENVFSTAMRFNQTPPPPLPLRSNSATLVPPRSELSLLKTGNVTTALSIATNTTSTCNYPMKLSASAQQLWGGEDCNPDSPQPSPSDGVMLRRATVGLNPSAVPQVPCLTDDGRLSPCSSLGGASSGTCSSRSNINVVTVQATPAKVMHNHSVSPCSVMFDCDSPLLNTISADKEVAYAKRLATSGSMGSASPSSSLGAIGGLGRVSSSSGNNYEDMTNLAQKVAQLQSHLAAEQCQKATLEKQMRQLQEENDKLKRMTHETQSQLKKITSWFQSGQPQQP